MPEDKEYKKIVLTGNFIDKLLEDQGKKQTKNGGHNVANKELLTILKKNKEFKDKFNSISDTIEENQSYVPVRIKNWKSKKAAFFRFYFDKSGKQIKDLERIRHFGADNDDKDDNDSRELVVFGGKKTPSKKTGSKKTPSKKTGSKKTPSKKKTRPKKSKSVTLAQRNEKIKKKFEKNERDQLTIGDYTSAKHDYVEHLKKNPAYRLYNSEEKDKQRADYVKEIKERKFTKTDQLKLLFDKLYARGIYTTVPNVTDDYINKHIRNDLRSKVQAKKVIERKDANKYLDAPLKNDLKGSFDYGGFDQDIATSKNKAGKNDKKYDWVRTATSKKKRAYKKKN